MFCASVNSRGVHPPLPSPGISRAFAQILVPGMGHVKFFLCSGFGHLSTPGTALGHLTPQFWSRTPGFDHARNIWILKVIQDDHFRKNLFRFWPFVKYGSCAFDKSGILGSIWVLLVDKYKTPSRPKNKNPNNF